MDELKPIMEKFAASGWKRIAAPARAWLEGRADHDALVAAIRQVDKESGLPRGVRAFLPL